MITAARLPALLSGVPALISEEFMKKDKGLPKLLNKQFTL